MYSRIIIVISKLWNRIVRARRLWIPKSDDLLSASMKNLWPLPDCSALYPKSDEEVNRAQAWVEEKKSWVKTLPYGRTRAIYMSWVRYVQRRIDENREENRTHRRALEDQRRRSRDRDRDVYVDAIRKRMPKPPK